MVTQLGEGNNTCNTVDTIEDDNSEKSQSNSNNQTKNALPALTKEEDSVNEDNPTRTRILVQVYGTLQEQQRIS